MSVRRSQSGCSIDPRTEVTKFSMKPSDPVIDFVRAFACSGDIPITDASTLEGDLGITGDDALELIIAFVEKFNVDGTQFHMDNHFGAEGWDIFSRYSRSERNDLTISDLKEAVRLGVLKSPGQDGLRVK